MAAAKRRRHKRCKSVCAKNGNTNSESKHVRAEVQNSDGKIKCNCTVSWRFLNNKIKNISAIIELLFE